MDAEFAQQLCDLNNRFYRTWASSFSDTRHNIWPGWQKCLEETGLSRPDSKRAATNYYEEASDSLNKQSSSAGAPNEGVCGTLSAISKNAAAPSADKDNHVKNIQLLDVACGNLRYEAFLARSLPAFTISAHALDACKELPSNSVTIPSNMSIDFEQCDVIKELSAGRFAQSLRAGNQADLTVSFGFMHHIPLPEWQEAFIKALIDATAPEGYLCLSFWRFLSDENLAAKAKKTTARGITELGFEKRQFEKGDCLLGWKNEPGAYRYCHSFSESEIDDLIESVSSKAILKARFQADGRTGKMNEYAVLKKWQ